MRAPPPRAAGTRGGGSPPARGGGRAPQVAAPPFKKGGGGRTGPPLFCGPQKAAGERLCKKFAKATPQGGKAWYNIKQFKPKGGLAPCCP